MGRDGAAVCSSQAKDCELNARELWSKSPDMAVGELCPHSCGRCPQVAPMPSPPPPQTPCGAAGVLLMQFIVIATAGH